MRLVYTSMEGVVLESKTIDTFGDLNFTAFDGLLDELLIFDQALEEPAIKYLAGRSYLDISGNKFHISPMSDNLIPVTPGSDGSSLDVPQDASFLPKQRQTMLITKAGLRIPFFKKTTGTVFLSTGWMIIWI